MARGWRCSIFAALALVAHAAAAEVDAETLRVIDDVRTCVRLRPLALGHPHARGRSKRAKVDPQQERSGPIAHVRRLFGRLRWAMGIIVAYRLFKRALDRFLPIPEDDETDALDYVDFEKFLYEETPTPFPGQIAMLPH